MRQRGLLLIVFLITILMACQMRGQVEIRDTVIVHPKSASRSVSGLMGSSADTVWTKGVRFRAPLWFKVLALGPRTDYTDIVLRSPYITPSFGYPPELGCINVFDPNMVFTDLAAPWSTDTGCAKNPARYNYGFGCVGGLAGRGILDSGTTAKVVALQGLFLHCKHYHLSYTLLGSNPDGTADTVLFYDPGDSLSCVVLAAMLDSTRHLDGFEINVSRDSIDVGESAIVSVQAFDQFHEPFDLEPTYPVNVFISYGNNLADLVYSSGTGGEIVADTLVQIPYSDAHLGRIRLVPQPLPGPLLSKAKSRAPRLFVTACENVMLTATAMRTSVGVDEVRGSRGCLYVNQDRIDHFEVQVVPDTISHSDTATIIVRAKDKNNNNIAVSGAIPIHFQLDANGERYGSLMAPDGNRGVALGGIAYADARSGRVKYIADAEDPGDVPQMVTIRVVRGGYYNKRGSGVLWVSSARISDILLGETKYYQVKLDTVDATKLVFKELRKTSERSGDVLPGVEFTVSSLTGDTLGVYWEKKDEDGDDLEADLIRLVGRYWQQGKIFRVRLSAVYQDRSGSIVIEVKRPSRLGTDDTKRFSKDVFDRRIDIDSICIANGGKYGIPPQYIKGQIATEAVYAGGLGYAPSYRYEPFTTQFQGRTADESPESWSNSPFYVTASTMGSGDPVPDHKNVRYVSYAKSPRSVWYMLEQYSELASSPAPGGVTLYARRNADGTMNFDGYLSIQAFYDALLSELTAKMGNQKATSKARDSVATYLRDEWHGGLKNIVAQTRIAASYGLLQMLYPTALERGYFEDAHNPPENLNVNTTLFSFAMSYQLYLLEQVVGGSPAATNNWSIGYNKALKLMYQSWDPYMGGYANRVIRNAQDFLPQP